MFSKPFFSSLSILAIVVIYIVCSTEIYSQSWISSLTPHQNQLNVIKSSPITIVFTRAINQQTINDSTIKVYGSFHGFYTATNFVYNNTTKSLTFHATSNFQTGENILITLTRGIKDSSGNPMPSAFMWGFVIVASSGSGVFQRNQMINVGNEPLSLVCADFFNNGNLDIAVGNWLSNTLTILKNNGSGQFSQSQVITYIHNPRGLCCGDLDGDGFIDLIAADETNNTIYILRNDGTGHFYLNYTLANPGGRPIPISLTDVDGDGHLDLVFADWDSNAVYIYKNDGIGNLQLYSSFDPGIRPLSLAFGDFDKNGTLDLAVGIDWGPPLIVVYKNDGNGNFTQPSTYIIQDRPYGIVTTDFNSDGNLDIVDINLYANSLSLFNNNGYGIFLESFFPTGGNYGRTVIDGDFNADGLMDLLVPNQMTNNFTFFRNSGTGNFVTTIIPDPDGSPFDVVKGDFNGDGSMDFAATNFNSNTVSIFMDSPLGIQKISGNVPKDFALYQNYPNPFNPTTKIKFDLPKSSSVFIKIYDIMGREVGTLVNNEYLHSGSYELSYDGSKNASGVYFYRIAAGNYTATKKMIIVK